jgi:hypothetical protein
MLVEECQFLKEWGFTAENEEMVIFRIPEGEAYFWTMKTNFDPKKVIKFVLNQNANWSKFLYFYYLETWVFVQAVGQAQTVHRVSTRLQISHLYCII